MTKTAKAVTGRLRKKIQRQLSEVRRARRRSAGPAALPIPAAPRIRPPASPAFSAGSAAKVMPRIAGHISAPPIPISTRAAISQASVWRDAAGERHRGEDRRADEEGAPAPEQVGQAAAGDDQDPEGERVGVDHPLRGGDVGVEVLLDRGMATLIAEKSLAITKTAIPIAISASQVPRSIGCFAGHPAHPTGAGGRRARHLARLAAWPTPPPSSFAARSSGRSRTGPSRCASGTEARSSRRGPGRR